MKSLFQTAALALITGLSAFSQAAPPPNASAPPSADTQSSPGKVFDTLAEDALRAMTKRAEELRIQGVAVVAFIEADPVRSWSSKMAVVGALKKDPSSKDRGVNLLAIAYSKAAEMADTLKASGSGVRPPMTGEFGWQGGLIQPGKRGYLIAAFSGGPSESDVKVSQAGLEVLAGKL